MTSRGAVLLGATSLVVLLLVIILSAAPVVPPRCPEGMTATGSRCCGEGQRAVAGACLGAPTCCGPGLERTAQGCVAKPRRVRVEAGTSSWKPPDERVGTQGERASTGAFEVDVTEATWARWRACEDDRACPHLDAPWGGDPGQAVYGMTRPEARAYCAWSGGRLPQDEEWLRIALGAKETRYPWGDPDAFCLRAAYGLVDGPCGRDAHGPDTAGARPWGATPAGVLDVAGNVAEWVEGEAPAGMGIARGGSYEDDDASALRPRWRRNVDDRARLTWIGVRCVYDVGK